MKVYHSSMKRLPGSDYREVYKVATNYYNKVKASTKRQPYIRSAYFRKEKIFLRLFWEHLMQKSMKERIKRMKLLPCAIDLLKNSVLDPVTKTNPDRPSDLLHRFAGVTCQGEVFFVQVKENRRTDQKWLMSAFPLE